MGWKSKKDGTHFNTDKTVRSSEPSTEINMEIDNNSDEFSEGIKRDFDREQQKAFFSVIAENENNEFEKLVEATSKEYILNNSSEFFGDGIKILDINSEIYKNARTYPQALKMMRDRFGFDVINDERVYY